MNPSEPLRVPCAASPPSTEAYESLLAAQVAMAGQVWKDAALVATLATTRMPTAAARLMLAHMQGAFAGYGDQALRLGAMFRMPAPARAAATGKPHRSIPV